jgi:hypothetical protein
LVFFRAHQWPYFLTLLPICHPLLGTDGGLFFVSITLLEAFFDGELISTDNGHYMAGGKFYPLGLG